MLKKFLSGKKTGFYLSALGFLFALLTLIVYTARGGNYLSPVSAAAVVVLVIGLITNILCLFKDFGILGIVPVVLYASSLTVLLNTEMLFISNVAFGVDGNSFDVAFFLFWIFDILATVLTAVGFSIGLSKEKTAVSEK